MSVIQISAKELHNKIQIDHKLLLLDVREPYEFELAFIEGSLNIPMQQIAQRINEIQVSTSCAVICHHGIRSNHVAEYLINSGFTEILNLSGGIDAWSVECDNTVSRY